MVTDTKKKKVLVLGGSGFLGKHVMQLLSEDATIIALSLSRRDGTDIRNLPVFTDTLKEINPDYIVNAAAHVGSLHYISEHAADVIYDNMQIVMNIYDAVKNACPNARIITPLSNCSYPGAADTHYEPEWENGPVHSSVLAYGSVKRMVYAFSESYKKQYGIKSINWLISNAYGPGDYTDPARTHALNGILMRLLQAKAANDKTFTIWGTGTPFREWVYITDVAKIMVHSIGLDEQISPINLAQNKAYSIKEIADMGAQALNYNVEFVFDTSKADGAPIKVLDDRMFRTSYPDFTFTPIADGIKNTVAYYEKML